MYKKRTNLDVDLNKLLDNPKFYQYFQSLTEANKIMNLTRIIDIDSVYYKHFYDSIVLTKCVNLKHKTLLDVGAGAGFPSIPLKIVEDDLNITIVDSLNKRIKFLETLTNELSLEGVTLIHGRAEELSKKKLFDIVTSRAVARLNILAELTIPFVKIGGYFIAYKSINYQEELEEAMNAIETLGGQVEVVEEYNINDDEVRVLIIIKKIKATKPIHPRIFGKIKNNPL